MTSTGLSTTTIQAASGIAIHPAQRFAPRRSASTVRARTAVNSGTETPKSQQHVAKFADPGLTAREIAVLGAWLRCDSKQEVCAVLHIALGTVNTHLTRIRAKYATVGRAAPTKASLVARALQDGLVTLDDL
ncbi:MULTISPECIES: LuxR C-terminal-related transcriptional regulator [unclassified Rhodococcus (in: high G+C Gram-positive bacteria)]|uniref:LuxR C-terminal-related transcriptional regulator n=1 Tax=unclassified Rhodococcus (in: high G+C Gram-positive bacteria) TaxID=192944 RepID=UPI002954099B|nr:LuxR C-terminal-related transcriptional regulator [Rhodococcus sp. IEGM 1343]MDV8053640.1 LuxR C-terminal-related transcriptional regulator [Rhodococcus sp. IEGM 1343]